MWDGTGGDTWSLGEARKVVEAAIAAGRTSTSSMPRTTAWRRELSSAEAAGITHGKDGKVKIIGFDFNRFALRNVQAGYWDADIQCNPRQAGQIDQWIKSGNIPKGIVYQEEIILDTNTITDEHIELYGINPDPGKGVITR